MWNTIVAMSWGIRSVVPSQMSYWKIRSETILDVVQGACQAEQKDYELKEH